MKGRRLIVLSVIAVLLLGGGILVSLGQQTYQVDFTSVVELWADVFRDADKVGLTITRVSDKQEMEFGAELAKSFGSTTSSDQKLQRYVSEIGQRLAKRARRQGIEYKFQVIEDFGINAFALPGGNIYITNGLLKLAKSEADVAATLAHEISHVELRHCIERFQYELLARRILSSDLAAIARLPYSFLSVAYSQQQEREADADAIVLMAKAGYHPKYDLALEDRMGQLETYTRQATPPTLITQELGAAVWEALKEYFRTHPSWTDRLRGNATVLQRNERQWKSQSFYVGRANHAERISSVTNPIQTELRPYSEPPALMDYLSPGVYSHFKAMAVHVPSGLSSVASDEASPSTAITRAVSRCDIKMKPCQLYALGDKVVVDMSPNALDAFVSEYLKSGDVARAYRSYLSAGDFKALAVDPSSGQTGTGLGHATVSDAIQDALARCSEERKNCELYAVGEAVVQGLPKEQFDLAVEQYREKIMADRIEKLQQTYLNNRTSKDFKAFAVDYRSGRSAASEAQLTPSRAIERAIADCSTKAISCEVHAIGNIIVSGKTGIERDTITRQYAREVIERISAGELGEYLGKKEFKVFVADVSTGYWRYQSGYWHPLAALNLALKLCREKGRDCTAAFVGDRFVFDRSASDLAEAIDSYHKEATWPANIKNPLREYLNEEKFVDFKAFAADPTQKNWQRESGRSSPNKAIEETVALCRSRNTLCELYAIGNHIVFAQSDEEKKATAVSYAREVLEKKLEFFRQPSYADFKAVAGNPDIMTYGLSLSYDRTSANDAVQEALRTCSEQFAPCQIFAVGDVVVFGMPQERIDQLVEEYQRDVDAARQISQ
jgi:Zn-dependent protease with chaperone function